MLTSIALHGIFFTVIFPQWQDTNSSNANNNLGNTPVVELNTIEQTRLPNLTPPTASFNWDSLNTLPSADTSLPPIPLSAFDIPAPPTTGDFPMPTFDSSVLMNLPAPPSLPSPQNLPPVNYSDNFYLPTPSISTPTELPPPPPLNQNAIATLPPSNHFNTPQNGNIIDITADPTEERQITPEEAQMREKIFANSDIELTVNPRDVINGRVNYSPQIRGENDEPLAFQPNNILISKLQKQSQNTSDEEARKNYVAWAKEVQSVTPQQVTLTGIYPKDACVGKLEGNATYGVTVNSAGNAINTQLIKSSGYPLFNDQALRQIRSHSFANETGVNKPFHVYVNFNYNSEICPSLSISNVENTPPVNTPETSNTPSNINTPNLSKPSPTPSNINTPNLSKPSSPPSIPKEKTQSSTTIVTPVQPPSPSVTQPPVPISPKPIEIKPLVENPSESSQQTLEIETSPSKPIIKPTETNQTSEQDNSSELQ
ncbi:hypothetical protein GM3709_1048 [Geminocystis sp. NIES-3709]|nr:hypothetical protein GM3709_1048 [Geminocystis sp. NIES-3709]